MQDQIGMKIMSDEVVMEGKIVEVRNGAKKITRSYTFGYLSIRIQVGFEYYSVLVKSTEINRFGFLPKVGHWVHP